MILMSAGFIRSDYKAHFLKVYVLYKCIIRSHRVFCSDIIFYCRWKKRSLISISYNICHIPLVSLFDAIRCTCTLPEKQTTKLILSLYFTDTYAITNKTNSQGLFNFNLLIYKYLRTFSYLRPKTVCPHADLRSFILKIDSYTLL